jgi:hypothetical protein
MVSTRAENRSFRHYKHARQRPTRQTAPASNSGRLPRLNSFCMIRSSNLHRRVQLALRLAVSGGLRVSLVRFLLDQGDDHAVLVSLSQTRLGNAPVEIEEEHYEVEAELDERFLLMHVKLPEYLSRVEQVLVVEDPARSAPVCQQIKTHFFAFQATSGRLTIMAIQ